MTEDQSECDGCRRLMPARLLDAVLLDEDGNDASSEAYCEACWPKYQRVQMDIWDPLGDRP
jgi:hypothetical protein